MIEIAPFLMVVAIVGIVSWSRLQRAKYAGGAVDGRPDPEVAQLRGEVRQLKDRIAVIERIVTDGDTTRAIALEREIAALRDAREAAEERP